MVLSKTVSTLGNVQAATAIKQNMTDLDRRRTGDTERRVVGGEDSKVFSKGHISLGRGRPPSPILWRVDTPMTCRICQHGLMLQKGIQSQVIWYAIVIEK